MKSISSASGIQLGIIYRHDSFLEPPKTVPAQAHPPVNYPDYFDIKNSHRNLWGPNGTKTVILI